MRISRLLFVAAATAALALPAVPAMAAHNGNNKAPLSGEGTSGTALVNYSEGTGTFSGTSSVKGLNPGETYSYNVVSPNGQVVTEVCTFVADGGSDGCSFQGTKLGGFASATIEDDLGNVVASGTFERRGNCRDRDQGGSQCEANDAPGQNK